jgi:acyl-CoA hydrolase
VPKLSSWRDDTRIGSGARETGRLERTLAQLELGSGSGSGSGGGRVDLVSPAMGAQSPSGKRVAESEATMTEYVLPTHANALGNVFGGQILAWLDLCAAICAQRHTSRICITAGIDELSFEKPIKVGQVVCLRARVTATFRTSLEILVDVQGENAMTGERWPCVTALVTYVAVDDARKPTPIPQLRIETDAERALAEAAAVRRADRLARRKRPAGG